MQLDLDFNFHKDEYQVKLDKIDSDIETNEQLVNDIKDEIERLRLRVAELTGQRGDVVKLISDLKDEKYHISQEREKELKRRMAEEEISRTAHKITEILKDFPAWEKAWDFQKEDITTCIHAYLQGAEGFLNANDMALGKTFESLVTLKVLDVLFHAEHGRKPKILWLTKTQILETGGTVREANKWYPDFRFIPVSGSMPAQQREFLITVLGTMEAGIITNYETVRTTQAMKDTVWDIIVMDEVHKLKGGANAGGPTQIWKAVREICENARMVVMLSGTPMQNKPSEMWAYLHIFDPDRFPSLRDFEQIFTIYDYNSGGYVVDANKLLESALKGRMVRRTKKEVGIQVPEVTPYEDRDKLLEMTPRQRDVYNQMAESFFIWLDEQDDETPLSATSILAQLIRLRQINVWPVITFNQDVRDLDGNILYTVEKKLEVRESSKIDAVMDDLEAIGDEQFVLFSNFIEPLKEVKRRVEELGQTCEILSSETKDKSSLETNFQQGITRVFCINSAMGEGMNLQKSVDWPGGASYAGFLDLWWNRSRDDQCTDRIVRPGGIKSPEPCTVIHYKNIDSIDQFIDSIRDDKHRQISGVMEDNRLRPSDWKKLIKGEK